MHQQVMQQLKRQLEQELQEIEQRLEESERPQATELSIMIITLLIMPVI